MPIHGLAGSKPGYRTRTYYTYNTTQRYAETTDGPPYILRQHCTFNACPNIQDTDLLRRYRTFSMASLLLRRPLQRCIRRSWLAIQVASYKPYTLFGRLAWNPLTPFGRARVRPANATRPVQGRWGKRLHGKPYRDA